jgi:deferrochelatase/peroxidase EfeB
MSELSRLSRRRFLAAGSLGLAAGATLASGASAAGAPAPAAAGARQAQDTPAPGPPQPGIITPSTTAVVVAGLQVIVGTRERLEHLLRSLHEEIQLLAVAEAGAAALPLVPRRRATDSGELGYHPLDGATVDVTVGFGASLFGGEGIGPDRFGLAALRPRGLTPMPAFQGDDLDPADTDSDLFLQIGAGHPVVAFHALRHLLRRLRWGVDLKFAHPGFGFFPGSGDPAPRGLLGYHDGTANLRSQDSAAMAQHVWIQPEDDEPGWCLGGTYLVFRRIRQLVELWDRESAQEQDQHFGRRKLDGVALAAPDAPAAASHDYADDPEGEVTPLAAHIRRANPHRPGDEASRILRRSFAYFDGDAGNTLDAGTLFICFQRNIERQFAAIKRRLDEPDDPALGSGQQTLSEYLVPIGGGYYFVPTAPATPDEYLGERLVASTADA